MKISKSGVPVGTVIDFGGGECPHGYLLCDGSTVSRSEYAALFEKIGTRHGAGDGATTFHLPDRRGRFPRGADNMGSGAAGRDPNASTRTAANAGGVTGNNPGTVQGDAIRNITGSFQGGSIKGGTGVFSVSENAGAGNLGNSDDYWRRGRYSFDASDQVPTAAENRPKNFATIYAIKY